MKYVLDTNVMIHLLRNSEVWQKIEQDYAPFSAEHQSFVSFATVAELLSLAKQIAWGTKKLKYLSELFNELEIVAVSGEDGDLLMQAYAEIDSFSQGKNPQIALPKGTTARNMGKNDVWIAATAYALQAKLISTDKDFIHLDKAFFDLVLIRS